MRLTFSLVALTLLCPHFWVHADPARYDLRVELGTEYDSNPDRSEQIANYAPPIPQTGPSPLARLVAAGNWASALGQSGGLSLSGAVAGKRFFDQTARGDDVLIAQAGANGTLRVAGRTILGLAGSYYDAFQRGPVDPRDFRSLTPALRIEQGFAQAAQFTLGGGYRWFTFKSDDNFSFAGPTAFVTARQMFPGNLERGGADWEWTAGASLEWRGFEGLACINETCTAETSAPPRRLDRFWVSHVELARTTTFLLGAGAALHINQACCEACFTCARWCPCRGRCRCPHALIWQRPTTGLPCLWRRWRRTRTPARLWSASKTKTEVPCASSWRALSRKASRSERAT